MNNKEIKPSKAIWNHYNRGLNAEFGITTDLILSSLADVIAGYHISYSATELLKDLGYIKITEMEKRTITKQGKLMLSHELHERYHRGVKTYHQIVNPHDVSTSKDNGNGQKTE